MIKLQKKICIVSPSYISSTPRVVKEADALQKAGFNVRVVFTQGNLAEVKRFDSLLLENKPWRWQIVKWSSSNPQERLLCGWSKLRHSIAQRLPQVFYSSGKFAEYAQGRFYSEMAKLAVSEQADLYIGHYPAGLTVAAYAAFFWKTKLGYDVEDLYVGENIAVKEKERIALIEKRYLPYCAQVTTVSRLVAEEMAQRYNIHCPLPIHNVFPWKDRESLDGEVKDRKGDALSLYWYSQVIGEDRGIQDAIKAAGFLKQKIQIHLRGYISQNTKNKFVALAKQCGQEDSLYFHSSVPTDELLSRAAEHDIGLAVDHPLTLSRDISITNKLFFYLLAGLAVAATDILGQKEVMASCPDAGFIYKSNDYHSLAQWLNALIISPEKVKACKQAALKAARDKWNWEAESQKLVENTRGLWQ